MSPPIALNPSVYATWAEIRRHHPDLPQLAAVTFPARTVCPIEVSAEGVTLAVGADTLAGGPERILAALLHQAAHALAHVRSLADLSREGRYHNRRYAELAQEVGLSVKQSASAGSANTHTGEDTLTRYAEQVEEIREAWAGLGVREDQPTAPTRAQITGRSSNRNGVSASCACKRHIRVSRTTLEQGKIICGLCSQSFVAG